MLCVVRCRLQADAVVSCAGVWLAGVWLAGVLHHQGHKRPWGWSLRFHIQSLEEEWLEQLYRRRRRRTWWLEAIGTIVFLLLVLTDLGSTFQLNEEMDSFTWWKVGFRLGFGFLAASLLVLEVVSRPVRHHLWLQIRGLNVFLLCFWAVVFSPTGGLSELMQSDAILATCSNGGTYAMQVSARAVVIVTFLCWHSKRKRMLTNVLCGHW